MDYITKFYKNRAEDLYEKVIALENKLKMINEAMTGAYPSTYTVSSRTPTARKNYKGDAQQEFAARSAEAGGSYQVDSSGYLQSRYNPSSVKNSNPNARTPTTSSVPGGDEIARMSQLKPANPMVGNVGSPSDLRTVTLPSDFHSSNAMPVDATEDPNRAFFNTTMTDLIGTVAQFSPFGGMQPGTVSGPASSEDYKKAADEAAERRKARGIELPPESKSEPTPAPTPAPTPVQQAAASPAAAPAWIPNSLFAVPPSAVQYAPTSSSLPKRNPAIGAAVKPGEVSIDPNRNAVQNQVLPVAKAPLATPAAKVVIPQNSVVPGYQKPNPEVSPKPAQAAPAPAQQGEDFSKFWTGKPRYGDLELQNMMRQHKRTNAFGPAIPDEKQSIEYRAAKAELIRRGKLKA